MRDSALCLMLIAINLLFDNISDDNVMDAHTPDHFVSFHSDRPILGRTWK